MITVHKFPLLGDTLRVPASFQPLHVGLDPIGVPCLWAKVDSRAVKQEVALHLIWTGDEIPPDTDYVGTYMQGDFVSHVFLQQRVWLPFPT